MKTKRDAFSLWQRLFQQYSKIERYQIRPKDDLANAVFDQLLICRLTGQSPAPVLSLEALGGTRRRSGRMTVKPSANL